MFGVWRGSAIVFIAASLGASVVYAVGSRMAKFAWIQRVTRDPRVAAVQAAIRGESLWIMFLLRLSPLIPYNILNYALALSGVRYVDFLIALIGMIPPIIMYTYYVKVVVDVAAIFASVSPPRVPAYCVLPLIVIIALV